MKLTRRIAFLLSIAKWEAIIGNNGVESSNQFIEIEGFNVINLKANCGLCEKYHHSTNRTIISCAKCPIRPKVKDYDDELESGCHQDIHPYYIWLQDSNVDNAKAVLKLIKSKQ